MYNKTIINASKGLSVSALFQAIRLQPQRKGDDRMPKQYGKLREEIGRKFDIQPEFAKAMNMSLTTLNNKLNGKTEWKISEIAKAMNVLNLPMSKLEEYFFYG